jgi:hypothetical protein
MVNFLIPEAQKLILGQPLTVYTPYDVGGFLNSKGGLWLSDSCLLKYQAQLLEGTEVTKDLSKSQSHILPTGGGGKT